MRFISKSGLPRISLFVAALIAALTLVVTPLPAKAGLIDMIVSAGRLVGVVPPAEDDFRSTATGGPAERGYTIQATCIPCVAFNAVASVIETTVPDMVNVVATASAPYVGLILVPWLVVYFLRVMGLAALGNSRVQPINFYKFAQIGLFALAASVILQGDVYEGVSETMYTLLTLPFIGIAVELLGVGGTGVTALISGMPDFSAACTSTDSVSGTLCHSMAAIDGVLAIGNALASAIMTASTSSKTYLGLPNIDFMIVSVLASVLLHVVFYVLRGLVALYIALFLARVMLLAVFTPMAVVAAVFPFTRSFAKRVVCAYVQNGMGMLGFTLAFAFCGVVMAQGFKVVAGFDATAAVSIQQLLGRYSDLLAKGNGDLFTLLGGMFGTAIVTSVVSVAVASSISNTAKALVACGVSEPEPVSVGGAVGSAVTMVAAVKTGGAAAIAGARATAKHSENNDKPKQ